MSDEKKIIIDEDWKSQVEQEWAAAENPTNPPAPDPNEIPPASFPMLVTSLGTQAMMALGQVPDPMSGKPMYHPVLARHHIDTLAILQEKTAGNLSDDEKEMLDNFVTQLRQLFIALKSSGFQIPTE